MRWLAKAHPISLGPRSLSRPIFGIPGAYYVVAAQPALPLAVPRRPPSGTPSCGALCNRCVSSPHERKLPAQKSPHYVGIGMRSL